MSERLELLRPILSKYKRRFSVLDFGAGINHPTLGFEIAQEFDAVVVEVEKGWRPCEIGPRTMVLQHEFTAQDLARLNECEHFDVVLGLNILHWFEADWKAATSALLAMGDFVYVQIPTAEDVTAPGHVYQKYLTGYIERQCDLIGETSQFPGHPARPIYLRKNGVKTLTRTCWNAPEANGKVDVYSTFQDISYTNASKSEAGIRSWVPGINLANALHWSMVWPTPRRLVEMFDAMPAPYAPHGDITMHNLVIDGERLHLIDGYEGWVGDDDLTTMTRARKQLEERC